MSIKNEFIHEILIDKEFHECLNYCGTINCYSWIYLSDKRECLILNFPMILKILHYILDYDKTSLDVITMSPIEISDYRYC